MSLDEKVYPGTIVRAQTDDSGNAVAERLPWWESDTTYAETGSGRARLKKREHAPSLIERTPIVKRTPKERADGLAQMFINQLNTMSLAAGRPLEPADLSDDWLRTFGLEFWKRGEPIGIEEMRRIAGIYLEAVKRGSGHDARWTPNS